MTEIAVGSLWEVRGGNGRVVRILDVNRDLRLSIAYRVDDEDGVVGCRSPEVFLRDFTPHVPPAPEPPLTGEQMAYVLETLGKAMGDPTLIACAKEFRK